MGQKDYGLQFTYWTGRESDCSEWYEWFNAKQIPAAIIHKQGQFAVFRRGPVARRGQHGAVRMVELRTKVFGNAEVIASCNGYEVTKI